ncbi:hypothetical protein GA0115252_11834 [Streptomyces sp. DfronAA-171]|nr:hypothetical protein GA0115252_11834 [Streptomyces sp. DfronAA-171]
MELPCGPPPSPPRVPPPARRASASRAGNTAPVLPLGRVSRLRDTIPSVLDIGYALSRRHPDSPQTDYRRADRYALRHDLFLGDVYLADTEEDRELATAWGWVPVLDFAWALCDIAELLDQDPMGSRASRPQYAELDFTESADRLLFARRFGWVDIEAEWRPESERPLSFAHAELRREARDFLHDLLADLTETHEELDENPLVWDLRARFPRVS